ncbi:MAG: hypothetical protein IH798_05045 [Gemmatimonadetes bacterium]|nr:hypothetical protein [Gemmatimonadota bacterium]
MPPEDSRWETEAAKSGAAEAGVRPHVTTYPLEDANRALQDMKHSRTDGTGVLVM